MESLDDRLYPLYSFRLLAVLLIIAFWPPYHCLGVLVISTIWLRYWQCKVFSDLDCFSKTSKVDIVEA